MMMGLTVGRDEPPAFFRPETIRVSLWLVLGLWLARQVGRLLVWIPAECLAEHVARLRATQARKSA